MLYITVGLSCISWKLVGQKQTYPERKYFTESKANLFYLTNESSMLPDKKV